MKKSTIIWIVVILVIVIGCGTGCSRYNAMTVQEQEVESTWANVQAAYQRRADLIPNLVSTVKGYAAHESQTFEKVTEARAKAGSININAENLDETTLARFQAAQSELASAMKSLLAVSEAYPDLKANENFINLQTQLEQTENRINTERVRYNAAAKTYNTLIRKFPGNILAGLFGFDKKPYFEADISAQSAPQVQF